MNNPLKFIALFVAMLALSAGSAYLAFEASPEPIVLTETVEVEKPVEVVVTKVVEKEVPVEVEVEYDSTMYIAMVQVDGKRVPQRVTEDYEPTEDTLWVAKISANLGNKVIGSRFYYMLPGDTENLYAYTLNITGASEIAVEFVYYWDEATGEEDEF